jgi:tRNA/rRNA methyltransferase
LPELGRPVDNSATPFPERTNLDSLAPPGGLSPDTLSLIRVVLVDTSHPGNIGSAARAMKTMGLKSLVLVNPRFADALTSSDALALATGADDILARARIEGSLDAALTGSRFAVAFSARGRDLGPPHLELEAAAQKVLDHAIDGSEVALVFGGERYGLDNQDVLRCQAYTSIPTSPSYRSLNLAQAVQIAAYECQRAARVLAAVGAPAKGHTEKLASAEERERMFAHLEEALVKIDFIDPDNPRRLVQRLRRLFSRTELESEEIAILRGICTQILSGRRR